MHPDVEFFTISNRSYFPGLVGLVNSLRLGGHGEPVTVLDRGLSRRQKSAVERQCRIVSIDREAVNPCHLTAYPALLDVPDIVILIDSDALVLDRLEEVIREARNGSICMFRDTDDGRFFREWSDIFQLDQPLRRQPYYQTGLVAFSTRAWPDLLDRWWNVLGRIRHRPTFMEGASMRGDPTSQPDQDALNALLMSEYPPGSVHELPSRVNALRNQLPKVEIVDRENMTCRIDGEPVRILHCSGSPKPWTWTILRGRRPFSCYLPLLRRVLSREDTPIRVPYWLLPPWLWGGWVGDRSIEMVKRLLPCAA